MGPGLVARLFSPVGRSIREAWAPPVERLLAGFLCFEAVKSGINRFLLRLVAQGMGGANNGGVMRVLLIEDDNAMARSIELMLRSEGFNVYTTDLGEEGIDLGKLYDYDIIVLDLQLPDMHGFDVLKALRLGKGRTPVLILSGNPSSKRK